MTAVATRGMPGHTRGDAAQLEADFRGTGGPARIAAAEDDVLHPVAAQALGALLAEHPRERIDDVALAAAVRPDDGRDAGVEGQLGSIRKALEAGNLQTLQSHGFGSLPRQKMKKPRHTSDATASVAEAAGSASKR